MEGEEPTLTREVDGESDEAVLARKPANKGGVARWRSWWSEGPRRRGIRTPEPGPVRRDRKERTKGWRGCVQRSDRDGVSGLWQ